MWPGVDFQIQNGWTIAVDEGSETIWSFAPVGHPAYPTAVKRYLVKTSQGISVQTNILCGGTEAACDKLPAEFRQLDEEIKHRLFTPPQQ
jgi:hypothetical protein